MYSQRKQNKLIRSPAYQFAQKLAGLAGIVGVGAVITISTFAAASKPTTFNAAPYNNSDTTQSPLGTTTTPAVQPTLDTANIPDSVTGVGKSSTIPETTTPSSDGTSTGPTTQDSLTAPGAIFNHPGSTTTPSGSNNTFGSTSTPGSFTVPKGSYTSPGSTTTPSGLSPVRQYDHPVELPPVPAVRPHPVELSPVPAVRPHPVELTSPGIDHPVELQSRQHDHTQWSLTSPGSTTTQWSSHQSWADHTQWSSHQSRQRPHPVELCPGSADPHHTQWLLSPVLQPTTPTASPVLTGLLHLAVTNRAPVGELSPVPAVQPRPVELSPVPAEPRPVELSPVPADHAQWNSPVPAAHAQWNSHQSQ